MTAAVWLKCGELSLIVGPDVRQFDGLPNCLALSFDELERLLWWIEHQRAFDREIPNPFPVEHLRAISDVKQIFPGARVADMLRDILARKR